MTTWTKGMPQDNGNYILHLDCESGVWHTSFEPPSWPDFSLKPPDPYVLLVRALTTAIVVDGKVLDADLGQDLIAAAKKLCETIGTP